MFGLSTFFQSLSDSRNLQGPDLTNDLFVFLICVCFFAFVSFGQLLLGTSDKSRQLDTKHQRWISTVA